MESYMLCTFVSMSERSHNPFVLRHPMSLGDVIAALFRAKPKRAGFSKNPPGIRPAFSKVERRGAGTPPPGSAENRRNPFFPSIN